MSASSLSARARAKFAAIGAGAILAAAALVVVPSLPDGGQARYTATFGRAGQGLDEKSDVKVRGMAVGRVEAVELRPDGRVRVRLRVDGDLRVPRATEARVDPVSVFGPKEISLDFGDRAGPALRDGEAIARTRDASDPADTAWPAYRLTRALDPQDLATLTHTFAAGLSGRGPALRRTIGNTATVVDGTHANRAVLQGLIRDITGVSGVLGTRGDEIVRTTGDLADLSSLPDDRMGALLDETARLAATVGGTLDRRGADLGRLVDGAAGAAGVLNAAGPDLIQLIAGLEGFFGGIAAIMHVDGPARTSPAMLRVPLSPDICSLIVDLCPRSPAAP
ncbi:MlaD family protein [Actinomadura flavalba]|uniref:MlaD family protein n=1 Tax=Actinomadura flavalba TaxID=1120938 RepID=UPI0003657EC6|nr:MlaD family protein [Actinomadura flavalba]